MDGALLIVTVILWQIDGDDDDDETGPATAKARSPCMLLYPSVCIGRHLSIVFLRVVGVRLAPLPIRPPVSPSLRLRISPSVCLSVCLSVPVLLRLSVRQFLLPIRH